MTQKEMMIDPYKTTPITIIEKTRLTTDQILLRLGATLNFVPGQFIEISLPGFGEGPVAPCSDPNEKKFFEIVVRQVGSLTKKVSSLVVGDQLFFRGPYGNGWPIKKLKNKDLILMAGGMGLIPLRPLIFEAMEKRHYFGKIYLLIGSKNPDNFLFQDEYKNWVKKLYYLKTIVDQASTNYKGRTGVLPDLLGPLEIKSHKTAALICGPEVMCPFCVTKLVDKKIAISDIFLSLERRMRCGIGECQHCNVGKYLVCQDGPVFSWDQIKDEINK